jgi:hypothetical protein
MDIIFDLFTLRNTNRPYSEAELKDMRKKDHTIRDDDKRSRLQRATSFRDVDNEIDDNSDKKNGQETKVEMAKQQQKQQLE